MHMDRGSLHPPASAAGSRFVFGSLMDRVALMGSFAATRLRGRQETLKIHFEIIAEKLSAHISAGNGAQASMLNS